MIATTFKPLFFVFCFFTMFISSVNANIEESQSNDIFEYIESEQADKSISDSAEIVRSEKAQIHYDEIKEVLGREEFGKTEYEKAWRKIDTSNKEDRESKLPEWIIKFLEWLEKRDPPKQSSSDVSFIDFASFLEIIIWILVIGLIVFVLVKYHKEIKSFATLLGGRKPNTQSLPTTMFGLDIKKESLPEDIVGTAKQHWANGEVRYAIAILLRASLIKLLNEHDCRFYDSDTEAECCLRIDKQAPKPLSQFMRSLVSVWQQVAYAHRSPSQDKFDALCNQWQEVF